ncbi:NTP transferase domain-containing protein [Rubrivirga sp. S365]|uniref:NTP transferase domain-containing protein n=1 Tax=Rubrivirga litoralis TaxID=3075598 RepID=A0ABU3BNR5_9BACT|nr:MULTISPECIES: NTP transferase domain-containing protein [unclassified Rubrivirga]MDT0630944.1 NTP transferase domain-containing protein [Rubrivirga sp. F394]MDT7856587.1 NTP transferase domain-containing protein [Rubrivirga sp. S365]
MSAAGHPAPAGTGGAGREPAGRAGLVLAAGFGSRLAGVDAGTALKPLTPVAGVPLAARTLRGLERAGCARAVVVLGFEPDEVRAGVEAAYDGPLELAFVVNERYADSNGVSVLAARPHLDGPFVLTMADHVVGDEVWDLVRDHRPAPDGATLLVDYKLETVFDMDDATKVQTANGRVVAIGKELEAFDAVDTGVFVCTDALPDALAAVDRERGDAALSDGVRRLAERGRMAALDVGDGFWQDVDTPAMLAHAERRLGERGGAA